MPYSTAARMAVASLAAAAVAWPAAGCAEGGSSAGRSPATDGQPSSVTSSPRWEGIYQYDPVRPTFRPCEHALPFRLAGSDSLLGLLLARVDFQSRRPLTRLVVALTGDTTRPDPQLPPVLGMTGLLDTRAPVGGECAALRPVPAPPLREAALRTALRSAAPGVSPSGWRAAPAYVDGDVSGDAVVLLTAGSSCTSAGCDLLVLVTDGAGYRLAGRTAHVKPPVAVREARSDGHRELLVGVGQGGGFPDRDARLRYRAGRGYPPDAALEPPAVRDPNALVLIGAGGR